VPDLLYEPPRVCGSPPLASPDGVAGTRTINPVSRRNGGLKDTVNFTN
jgi:hypothetical protein